MIYPIEIGLVNGNGEEVITFYQVKEYTISPNGICSIEAKENKYKVYLTNLNMIIRQTKKGVEK